MLVYQRAPWRKGGLGTPHCVGTQLNDAPPFSYRPLGLPGAGLTALQSVPNRADNNFQAALARYQVIGFKVHVSHPLRPLGVALCGSSCLGDATPALPARTVPVREITSLQPGTADS